MRALLAACVLATACAHDPNAAPAGCETYELAEPGLTGWKVLECRHPFTSVNPDRGLPETCPATRGAAEHAGVPVRLPCGWTDGVTDCARKEIRLWDFRVAGAYEHELTHARACK